MMKQEYKQKHNHKHKRAIAAIIIVVVCAFAVVTAVAFSADRGYETSINISETEFGRKYTSELSQMKNLHFYVKYDDESGDKILAVFSDSPIKDNIVLFHMVITHLNEIVDSGEQIDKIEGVDGNIGNNVKVLEYRADGGNFVDSFVNDEYKKAVDENEQKLNLK